MPVVYQSTPRGEKQAPGDRQGAPEAADRASGCGLKLATAAGANGLKTEGLNNRPPSAACLALAVSGRRSCCAA
jgi:hypothetical protein